MKFSQDLFFKRFQNKTKDIFGKKNITLHRPVFIGNEKKYLIECIDSNFVSSVGKMVDRFENLVADFTGIKNAVATVNGTSALHSALALFDTNDNDEVITQSLTFVATCNAISYTGAKPVFIDVDLDTLGMSPNALEDFLLKNTFKKNGKTFNKRTKKRIKACIPMHTYGNVLRIQEIKKICKNNNIYLIEDCAESLGSYYKEKHTGSFGDLAIFSFNGNKVITTGGGGMIVTNNKNLAKKAKHLTTTGKKPHQFKFEHDIAAYNYRLPNINAALGCAQMENLNDFLNKKKKVAKEWENFFQKEQPKFFKPRPNTTSNNWLNCIIFDSPKDASNFLKISNSNGIMTRPAWKLMNELPMYKNCQSENLANSQYLQKRLVNIPSSVPD